VEEALGLEAEVFITGGQRNPPQGSDLGDTNLLHECHSASTCFIYGDK
jgi:hypothetical protein